MTFSPSSVLSSLTLLPEKWKILILGLLALASTIGGYMIYLFYTVPAPQIPSGLKGELVSVGGRNLRICQKGTGADILMIHGCPGALEDWDPIVDDLAKRFRVTVYDRPGYGYSERLNSEYDLEFNALVAQQIIQALKLKDVTVVGHSYGSAVALTLAEKNDPNLRGFVLCASPGYPIVHVKFWDYVLFLPKIGECVMAVAGKIAGAKLVREGIQEGFDPNQDKIPDGFIELRTEMWLRPQTMTTRAREYVYLERNLTRMAAHYKEIREKVVLIQGKSDEITKAAWKLHEDIPGSELTVFDGVGHYVQFARPKDVAEIILKTVRALQAPAPTRHRRPPALSRNE